MLERRMEAGERPLSALDRVHLFSYVDKDGHRGGGGADGGGETTSARGPTPLEEAVAGLDLRGGLHSGGSQSERRARRRLAGSGHLAREAASRVMYLMAAVDVDPADYRDPARAPASPRYGVSVLCRLRLYAGEQGAVLEARPPLARASPGGLLSTRRFTSAHGSLYEVAVYNAAAPQLDLLDPSGGPDASRMARIARLQSSQVAKAALATRRRFAGGITPALPAAAARMVFANAELCAAERFEGRSLSVEWSVHLPPERWQWANTQAPHAVAGVTQSSRVRRMDAVPAPHARTVPTGAARSGEGEAGPAMGARARVQDVRALYPPDGVPVAHFAMPIELELVERAADAEGALLSVGGTGWPLTLRSRAPSRPLALQQQASHRGGGSLVHRQPGRPAGGGIRVRASRRQRRCADSAGRHITGPDSPHRLSQRRRAAHLARDPQHSRAHVAARRNAAPAHGGLSGGRLSRAGGQRFRWRRRRGQGAAFWRAGPPSSFHWARGAGLRQQAWTPHGVIRGCASSCQRGLDREVRCSLAVSATSLPPDSTRRASGRGRVGRAGRPARAGQRRGVRRMPRPRRQRDSRGSTRRWGGRRPRRRCGPACRARRTRAPALRRLSPSCASSPSSLAAAAGRAPAAAGAPRAPSPPPLGEWHRSGRGGCLRWAVAHRRRTAPEPRARTGAKARKAEQPAHTGVRTRGRRGGGPCGSGAAQDAGVGVRKASSKDRWASNGKGRRRREAV